MTSEADFARVTEPHRRELLAHCYRMAGSPDEAEDLVQETYLRAWRGFDGFQGRSSVRVWLYRIATNVCLTALENRARRPLPSGLGGPCADPFAPLVMAAPDVEWLRPFPDPADVAASRESLRLALVASLQYLPARQRAVLILREVLDFPAAQVAAMLDTSVAAVKSTLQRARARLAEVTPSADADLVEPTDPAARALLADYVAAFENSDTTLLEQALRKDAALEMVGVSTWFAGNDTCLAYLATVIGSPGDWRMLPTTANGQPAVATYHRDAAGVHRAYGMAVLDIAANGIVRIVLWADTGLVARSGFPADLG